MVSGGRLFGSVARDSSSLRLFEMIFDDAGGYSVGMALHLLYADGPARTVTNDDSRKIQDAVSRVSSENVIGDGDCGAWR